MAYWVVAMAPSLLLTRPPWIDERTERTDLVRLLPVAWVVVVVAVAGCSAPLTAREEGALIGAGMGAVGGAIIGDAIEGSRERRYDRAYDRRWDREYEREREHEHDD